MRHRHGLRKLNRTSEHRAAMLRELAVVLETSEDGVSRELQRYGIEITPGSTAQSLLSQLGGRTWSEDVWPA